MVMCSLIRPGFSTTRVERLQKLPLREKRKGSQSNFFRITSKNHSVATSTYTKAKKLLNYAYETRPAFWHQTSDIYLVTNLQFLSVPSGNSPQYCNASNEFKREGIDFDVWL